VSRAGPSWRVRVEHHTPLGLAISHESTFKNYELALNYYHALDPEALNAEVVVQLRNIGKHCYENVFRKSPRKP
jgi:hypothetical protein